MKILSLLFYVDTVPVHTLSLYISLSYFMSENRSEIRETLNFIDFLRVVGICAVVYEDMLERERERETAKQKQ